jgi:hypothetical protein
MTRLTNGWFVDFISFRSYIIILKQKYTALHLIYEKINYSGVIITDKYKQKWSKV